MIPIFQMLEIWEGNKKKFGLKTREERAREFGMAEATFAKKKSDLKKAATAGRSFVTDFGGFGTWIRNNIFQSFSDSSFDIIQKINNLSAAREKWRSERTADAEVEYLELIEKVSREYAKNGVPYFAPQIRHFLHHLLFLNAVFIFVFEFGCDIRTKKKKTDRELTDRIKRLGLRVNSTDKAVSSRDELFVYWSGALDRAIAAYELMDSEFSKDQTVFINFAVLNMISAIETRELWRVSENVVIKPPIGPDSSQILRERWKLGRRIASELAQLFPSNASLALLALEFSSKLRDEEWCEFWAKELIKRDGDITDTFGASANPELNMRKEPGFAFALSLGVVAEIPGNPLNIKIKEAA